MAYNKVWCCGSHGTGKALPNDELVWSNKGLVEITNLVVGDKVVGRDGKYTEVIGVYPQPIPKPCYELTFRGGAKVRCSEDHLWTYKGKRAGTIIVEPLKTMLERGLKYTRPNPDNQGRYRYKHRYVLPKISPVEFSYKKDYPINPYTLGALIGDGCCRQKYLDISSSEESILKEISYIEGWTYKKQCENNYTYSLNYPDGTHVKNNNYLTNLYSYEKYIAKEYLEGSLEQRILLFQGLMDTDGSIVHRKNSNGVTFSYFTTSPKLVEDFLCLVRSFGIYAYVVEDNRKDRRKGYNIIIAIPPEFQKYVFRASKKKNKVKFSGKISSICLLEAEYIGELPCTCIKVAASDGLFLTKDFIPTHNTTQVEYFLQQVNDKTMHPKWQKLDMERRDLHAKGIINLNKRATPMDELVIAGNVAYGILSTSAPFISDRSFICKCAYSQALPFPEELIMAWHVINTMSFPGVEDNEIYFYFPPMIPLEDDGVRSIDPEYQKEIDYWVQWYLDYFQIPFHTIESYTVQDRHMEITQKVFGKI